MNSTRFVRRRWLFKRPAFRTIVVSAGSLAAFQPFTAAAERIASSWNPTSGQSWENPSNWLSTPTTGSYPKDVPGGDAFDVTVSGSTAADVSSAVTISSLDLQGMPGFGGGLQTNMFFGPSLRVTGAMNWTNATIDRLSTRVEGPLTITNGTITGAQVESAGHSIVETLHLFESGMGGGFGTAFTNLGVMDAKYSIHINAPFGSTSTQYSGARLINNATWDPLESTCRHASLSIL